MRMKKMVFQRASGRGWLLVLAWGVIACMSMGLVLVWVNIERMDTNYFINIAQTTLNERKVFDFLKKEAVVK